jgi:hypothetical protein
LGREVLIERLNEAAIEAASAALAVSDEYQRFGLIDQQTANILVRRLAVFEKAVHLIVTSGEMVGQLTTNAAEEKPKRKVVPTVLVPARKMIYDDFRAERAENFSEASIGMVRCVPNDLRITDDGKPEIQLTREGSWHPASYEENSATFVVMD